MKWMNWIGRTRLLIAFPFALFAHEGIARPIDATGACPLAATLVQAGSGAGVPAEVSTAARKLMAETRRRAADLPEWLSSDALSTSSFRLYQTAGRDDMMVLTRCKRTSCESERAYIGFASSSGMWGASIYLGGKVTELGQPLVPGSALQSMPEDVASAVICAQNLDWGN